MTSAAHDGIDEAKLEAFMERVIGDLGGTMTSLLCAVGDRLGLFAELARNGGATSVELAARAGIQERYAREWLAGLASAGYLEVERGTGRYALPPENAQALAVEGGPFFVGGVYQMLIAALRPFEKLVDSFRSGGGVSQSDFDPYFWEGMERFSAPAFENELVPLWLPAVPDVQAKLERGCVLADVGCGSGGALIKLAEAYPGSRFVGIDAFAGQLDRARENAQAAGVADRVSFELVDASGGLSGPFDVITTFDVVHDAVNPRDLLRSIREALADDGIYLMLEINAADDPHDNVGPLATMFWGFSVFYCLTTSLAHGGEGLGTCGLPEAKVRELCAEAGFSDVRRLAIENPFNILYEIRS
jgi:SAM-dependent methyltransferase